MESSEQVQAETYPELVTDSELEEHDDEPVTTTSKDWIVSVLEAKYKKGKIDLQPEYQREYVESTAGTSITFDRIPASRHTYSTDLLCRDAR